MQSEVGFFFLPAEIIRVFNLIHSLSLKSPPIAVDSFKLLFYAKFSMKNKLLWLTPEDIILILKHLDETSVPHCHERNHSLFHFCGGTVPL